MTRLAVLPGKAKAGNPTLKFLWHLPVLWLIHVATL